MRLDHFDLNLLIAFDALLSEHNVTRAARRLNVTQSAMSAALKRLRQTLNDDILVQHGKVMIPTSHALALAPEIASAIVNLRSLLSTATSFDPLTSTRRFRVAASDYITTVLVAPLLKVFEREAPHVQLEMSLPHNRGYVDMDDGKLDLLLSPDIYQSKDHPNELLFVERHVVAGCASNPVFRKPFTESAFYSCGHISARLGGLDTYIDTAMAKLGDRRRIEMIAPSFIQCPWMLPGTTRLALMHERLATLMAGPLSLAIAPPPFDLPVMNEMMQYHSTRVNDRGLAWLRGKLKSAARENALALNATRPPARGLTGNRVRARA